MLRRVIDPHHITATLVRGGRLLRASKWSNLSSVSSPGAACWFSTSPSSSDSHNNKGGVFDKIACVGAGMMAQAILEPLIKQGVQPAERISVYDVNDHALELAAKKFGVHTAKSLSDVVKDANLVLCAVKPQNLTPGFFKEIRKGKPGDDSILLSIVAGKTLSAFEKGGFSKIVRSMPNTPATIGQGMTVWSCTPNLSTDERRKIRDVLGTCGKQMYVDDESFIDMATSISGSGPAYIFMVRGWRAPEPWVGVCGVPHRRLGVSHLLASFIRRVVDFVSSWRL